ncbi:MAG TPA: response regulator [Candidatus Angelobacter sp.]
MSRKILFVDDCSTTLLMEQVLFAKRTDYNLTTARDGREAIQKAIVDPPDLILMDATLPNMDACREMRKIPELQRIPILLVSNGGEPSNIEDGFASGKVDRGKPLNWHGLFEMVNTYLTSHSVNR